jgi:ketosteroid isomerase-like protein
VSSDDDIELIRRSYAAWNRGDVEAIADIVADDVEIRPVLGDQVAANEFRGPDGLRRWAETLNTTMDDFEVDLQELIEIGGDQYLALLRFSGRGKASGAPVSLDAAHILTVVDGRLTRLIGYQSWNEGRAAAGI